MLKYLFSSWGEPGVPEARMEDKVVSKIQNQMIAFSAFETWEYGNVWFGTE